MLVEWIQILYMSSWRYDQPFWEKDVGRTIIGNLPDIFKLKLSLPPKLRGGECNVEWLFILQNYRPSGLHKRKTRGETQYWVALAALSILANHDEIISNDILRFIIFFTSVPYDGSNRFWRQRLLPPAMFPMSSYTNTTCIGVIWPAEYT